MPKPTATCDLEFSGTVISAPTHRAKLLDGQGHYVPVLELVVQLDSDAGQHCLLEQPFPVGHDEQCKAAARRIKKGQRVTFTAPLVGVRLMVPNVTQLHVQPTEERQAA